jgi:hypothetical protein
LAPLVRERFDASDPAGAAARRILESRAVDWAAGHTSSVLDESDLRVVEAGSAGMRGWTADEERLARQAGPRLTPDREGRAPAAGAR